MMIVDRLMKIAYSILTITIISFGVAELFMKEIFRYRRIPREIISDRNSKFISEFWTILFKLCETKIKPSIAYYFEIDGETK